MSFTEFTYQLIQGMTFFICPKYELYCSDGWVAINGEILLQEQN